MKNHILRTWARIKLSLYLAEWRIRQVFVYSVYKLSLIIAPIQVSQANHRLAEEYQDGWDRWCQMKEVEHEIKLVHDSADRTLLTFDLIQEITRFKILLIIYAACKSGKTEKMTIEDATEKIHVEREVIAKLLAKLSHLGVEMPEALKKAIFETPLSVMTSTGAANNYCKHINDLIDQITPNNE